MKQFYLIAFGLSILIGCSSSEAVQQNRAIVYDFEEILTKEQENVFQDLFKGHEQRTTNEIVLVTTSSYGDSGDILKYSVEFGSKHGIGKKGKDNGVVIVFSKKNRETRISTGNGTEKILTDQIAKEIIDSLMIPEFKNEEYYEGLLSGSVAIVDFLDKPENKIK